MDGTTREPGVAQKVTVTVLTFVVEARSRTLVEFATLTLQMTADAVPCLRGPPTPRLTIVISAVTLTRRQARVAMAGTVPDRVQFTQRGVSPLLN